MNLTIEADLTGYAPQGCRYTAIDADRYDGAPDSRSAIVGYGDSPSDALGDLLLQMLEAGDRSPELIAMLDAENQAALLRNEP